MSRGSRDWRKYLLTLAILVILVSLSEAHRGKLKARSEVLNSRTGTKEDNSFAPRRDYLKGRHVGKDRFGKSLDGINDVWKRNKRGVENLKGEVSSEEQPQGTIRLERLKDHKLVARWKVPETHRNAPVEAYVEEGVLRVRAVAEREGQPVTVEESLELPLEARFDEAKVSTVREGDDMLIKVSTQRKHHHKHQMFLEHLGEEGRQAYNTCKTVYRKDIVRIGGCICGNLSLVNESVACYDHLVNISAFYAEKFGCTNGSIALKEALETCLNMSDLEQHLNCSTIVYDKIVTAWDTLQSSGKMKKWKRKGIPEHLQDQITRILVSS
ncbi:uncharacterized protein Gasu_26120 [Galdieria sulphuraria]|uniref:Uncharacterized protein n=1 Tax=Galdieria sulphuraria TaxID=130081 RepID=M2X0Z0_GALSU|nr:uncharacterized protein Gasu_26120 [Galdieria sulphuraria]EME30025.1 hypothetical protein Gasu_26120 [Galdieria sulphuraria]|eukprot:XP_005706545.1 hypothetical protein Gasu_26120 [Galdieria sulphuraria]